MNDEAEAIQAFDGELAALVGELGYLRTRSRQAAEMQDRARAKFQAATRNWRHPKVGVTQAFQVRVADKQNVTTVHLDQAWTALGAYRMKHDDG